MVKKDRKWEWTEKQERVFEELNKRFIQELVLVVSDLDKKIRMEVDTSDYTIGDVLSMEEEGKWKPVVFFSKLLNKTKRNYEIYNKEILVIIRKLESWRYLLEEAQFKFEIWTDHKNLKYFMKA